MFFYFQSPLFTSSPIYNNKQKIRRSPMTQIRTISGAAEEIKRNDPYSAITEYRIRQLVNEKIIPYFPVGNRKLVNIEDIINYFGKTDYAS